MIQLINNTNSHGGIYYGMSSGQANEEGQFQHWHSTMCRSFYQDVQLLKVILICLGSGREFV